MFPNLLYLFRDMHEWTGMEWRIATYPAGIFRTVFLLWSYWEIWRSGLSSCCRPVFVYWVMVSQPTRENASPENMIYRENRRYSNPVEFHGVLFHFTLIYNMYDSSVVSSKGLSQKFNVTSIRKFIAKGGGGEKANAYFFHRPGDVDLKNRR